MPHPEITQLIADLRTAIIQSGSPKPNTVRHRLIEQSFISGVASAKGGAHKLPPAVLICAMSGRSILTLDKPQTKPTE